MTRATLTVVAVLVAVAFAALGTLKVGTLTANIRNRDTPRLMVSAVVIALAVAGYLVLLLET